MKRARILAVIPARGGSKSIQDKNIVLLGGRPLIAYTLDAVAGLKSNIDHVVSTDSKEIKEIAEKYGGHVPFMRPEGLARDDSNIIDVLHDCLGRIGRIYEYLLLLQPTAPLRGSEDIDDAIGLANQSGADSVCSFMKIKGYHPWYMYYYQDGKVRQVVPTEPGKPRQEFPEALWRNGAIYLVRTVRLLKDRVFITEDCVPYIMPPERSVNIDDPQDLEYAEYVLKRIKNKNLKSKLKIRSKRAKIISTV